MNTNKHKDNKQIQQGQGIEWVSINEHLKNKIVLTGNARIKGELKLLNHFHFAPKPFTLFFVRPVDANDWSTYQIFSTEKKEYIDPKTLDQALIELNILKLK